jgi:hypothetical protein
MGGNTDLTTGERGGVGDRRLRRLRLAEAGWGVCICTQFLVCAVNTPHIYSTGLKPLFTTSLI